MSSTPDAGAPSRIRLSHFWPERPLRFSSSTDFRSLEFRGSYLPISELQTAPQLDDSRPALFSAKEAVVLAANLADARGIDGRGRGVGDREVGMIEQVPAQRHDVEVPAFGQKEALPNS